MKNKFTIGEMSRLHSIPIKTLRYYDGIGLFKAVEVDGNNGYRYYSTEQFEQLNAIKYLKFLGFSLKEIQKHMETRDVASFITLLKQRQQITNNMIKNLRLVSDQFSNRISEIEQALNINVVEEPVLRYIPKRAIISIDEHIHSEPEWEMALRKLENITGGSPSLFIGRVGLTVAKKNIIDSRFDEYNSVFILWEEPFVENKFVRYFSEGNYACIYYRGNHSISKEYYVKVLQFISSKGYKINGDSIERTIIDDYITREKSLHLTELQIPVRIED
ncbi:MAG TPA: MerR family transcriptional regulator [Negativicutes bacterium]|jgi:effector-binding domain-containing protein